MQGNGRGSLQVHGQHVYCQLYQKFFFTILLQWPSWTMLTNFFVLMDVTQVAEWEDAWWQQWLELHAGGQRGGGRL